MDIVATLETKYQITDRKLFNEYLEFVKQHAINETSRGHWHHILPKAMFPEYKSRVGHPWNSVRLTAVGHYQAHYLLYRAVTCQATACAWWFMNNMRHTPGLDDKSLSLYQEVRAQIEDLCGKTMRGRVAAKDKAGSLYHVLRDDPRLSNGILTHFAKGTVNVQDANGNRFKTRINDPRYLSGELTHVRKGMLLTKNGQGEIVNVMTTDPRISSGELVPINKGFVLVTNQLGDYQRVAIDDPRYLSGELTHARRGKSMRGVNKGKMNVVGNDGVIRKVDRNDPLVKSGELVSTQKGRVSERGSTIIRG